ncbi:roundabout homolog 1-like [Argopecten irradians]|uniref:roundabout homolog 1-like n=1 Tax=Argopecten irradians TaxID=31199 RepID=UPI003717C5E9
MWQGESTISMHVTVQYGPGTSIAFISTNLIHTRTEGDTLPDITCTADCRPDCTFVWTRPDNTNFSVSPVLSLGQLDRSEHGTYRCTARNEVGESTISIIITVMYGPGSSILLLPQTMSYNEIEGDLFPEIICTADCRPDCTFVWTRPDNTNFTVSPVLSLGHLDRSEHGTYRCTARNVVGEAIKVNSITVQCEPRPHPTMHQNQMIDLLQSDTLVLHAMFTSFPAPSFTWTFNSFKSEHSQQLANGTDDVLILYTFDTENISARSVVTRQHIEEEWFGTYNVTATNHLGSTVLSFKVREIRYPGIPTNLMVICTEPNMAEVSWIGGGDTQRYQVLFSDDRFLNSRHVSPSLIPIKADGSDVNSVNIDLNGGRVYLFKIAAYNSYGNTTSADSVGCSVREECSCGTDSMFIAGIILMVVSLLVGVVIVIYVRHRKICCFSEQHTNHDKYQDIQLSDQVNENRNDEDLRGHGEVESFSNLNHYEELQSSISGNHGTYINTALAGED